MSWKIYTDFMSVEIMHIYLDCYLIKLPHQIKKGDCEEIHEYIFTISLKC